MPANSAQVVPRLATTSAATARAARRTPYASRTSPVRPWPVTTPMRAPRSWNSTSATVDSNSTHSSW